MSGGMRTVRLIAGRELSTRVKSKGYVIMTLALVVLIGGISVLFKLVGGDDPSKIGVLDGALSQPIAATAQSLGEKIETVTVGSQAEGEKKVRDEDLDALVLSGPVRVVVKKDLGDGLRNTLTVMVRQDALNAELARAGADPAAVGRAVASTSVGVTSLEGADDLKDQRVVLAMVAAFLLYGVLFSAGMMVAQGVVEEKSSRIVEILLSAVRPWQLMVGKVAGIGAVGFIQMLAATTAGVVAALATGVLDIPGGELVGTGLWGLVWFVVGFAMFALLFAATGALVSRQEDLGGVIMPVYMLLLIPYMLSFSLIPADPDGTAAKILSLVPFFAPVLMPVRSAMGAPVWWQFAGLGLTLVTIAALVWLAGRMYENSVLRMGSRIKLTDALRSAK
ncbi:ABC transporter permease [Actinocorallia longicatena]|uniref:ABC transporter permease n=1 Tax=Actinocorallia longicatena TaxID=111803 RepID=A0ABP6QK68_9ACTN